MFKLVFVPLAFRNFSGLTDALNGIGKLNEYEATYINRLNPDIDLPDNGTSIKVDECVDIDSEIIKNGNYAYVRTSSTGYNMNEYNGIKSIINKLNKQLDDRTVIMSRLYNLFVTKMYVKLF